MFACVVAQCSPRCDSVVATLPCSVPLTDDRLTCDVAMFSREEVRHPHFKSVAQHPCNTEASADAAG